MNYVDQAQGGERQSFTGSWGGFMALSYVVAVAVAYLFSFLSGSLQFSGLLFGLSYLTVSILLYGLLVGGVSDEKGNRLEILALGCLKIFLFFLFVITLSRVESAFLWSALAGLILPAILVFAPLLTWYSPALSCAGRNFSPTSSRNEIGG